MADPARPDVPEPLPEPRLRIASRTYSELTDPLVDVLVQLYEWSLERRARARTEGSGNAQGGIGYDH
jgi:hypothetical protein